MIDTAAIIETHAHYGKQKKMLNENDFMFSFIKKYKHNQFFSKFDIFLNFLMFM